MTGRTSHKAEAPERTIARLRREVSDLKSLIRNSVAGPECGFSNGATFLCGLNRFHHGGCMPVNRPQSYD